MRKRGMRGAGRSPAPCGDLAWVGGVRPPPAWSSRQEGHCLPTPRPPATTRRRTARLPNRTQAAGLHGHLPVYLMSWMLLHMPGVPLPVHGKDGPSAASCLSSVAKQDEWDLSSARLCPSCSSQPCVPPDRAQPMSSHLSCCWEQHQPLGPS